MFTTKTKVVKFFFAIALCQAAGIIGSLWTRPAIDAWYSQLNKPEFSPPNWIFAPVWTLLFFLMGIAFFLVLAAEHNSKEKQNAIYLFLFQLGLNVLWSFLFFGLQSPLYGFLEIMILWLAIALTIISFKKISKIAALLLLPYIIWVTFAGFLNFSIMSLNDPAVEKQILEKSNLIKVSLPIINQMIVSPLIVRGEARGYWFFEASFPVKILDGKGGVIGQGVAQAQSEWMTENFVPFEAIITFNNPNTKNGILVLEKDNPSGLPENADELRVPVRFNPDLKTITIKAFFNNSELDPEFSCNKVFAVDRQIPETKAVARAALEQLLFGPTQQDKVKGFFTSINSGVKIQSLSIENGIARVDFNDQLEFQVGGSCRVSAIRSQIMETLKQFSSVEEVIISINGKTEDILQP